MTDSEYEIATFETDVSPHPFIEDYNVLDEMVGANLARNINNQQLKKFYKNIPLDDYEENEQFHRGFSRGKQMMLEATRNWLCAYFGIEDNEIDSVLTMQRERPFLEVLIEGDDGNFHDPIDDPLDK